MTSSPFPTVSMPYGLLPLSPSLAPCVQVEEVLRQRHVSHLWQRLGQQRVSFVARFPCHQHTRIRPISLGARMVKLHGTPTLV